MSNEKQETIADIVAEMRKDIADGTVGIWSDFGGEIARVYADRIEAAHKREKAKPVRNCDNYRTAKDALAGFDKMCEEKTCYMCPFSAERNECLSCRFNWLYAEAERS